MNTKREKGYKMNLAANKKTLAASGAVLGLIAALLAYTGNPKNMAICVACFIRDISGAVKLHTTGTVQYMRPEIVGFVCGAFLIALITKEYRSTAGSSPMIRFLLGVIMMIGSLVFLGCPLRMVIRMSAGDLNAYVALIGFVGGVYTGTLALKHGFSLGRAYKVKTADGFVLPGFMIALLVLLLAVPSVLLFSTEGPGASHAPWIVALIAGLAVGALAQKSRLCMAGGIRDAVMFRDFNLLSGFGAIFVVVLVGNLILGRFQPTLAVQPVAHHDYLWSFLGMAAAGWGSILLGGCPLRQLILAGEGNGDSAVTVLGMIVGAALAHNFGMAGNADAMTDGTFTAGGVALPGRVGVVVCLILLAVISVANLYKKEKKNV